MPDYLCSDPGSGIIYRPNKLTGLQVGIDCDGPGLILNK
jgi:hypothetical protein